MAVFTIQGHEFTISMEDIEQKMATLEPALISDTMYTVKISGKVFPLKQPVMEVTGLTAEILTTLDAFSILDSLGYPVKFHRKLTASRDYYKLY